MERIYGPPANDRGQSGRGQPHSKTSRKERHANRRDSVLECGCPLPLSLLAHARAGIGSVRSCGHNQFPMIRYGDQ